MKPVEPTDREKLNELAMKIEVILTRLRELEKQVAKLSNDRKSSNHGPDSTN